MTRGPLAVFGAPVLDLNLNSIHCVALCKLFHPCLEPLNLTFLSKDYPLAFEI